MQNYRNYKSLLSKLTTVQNVKVLQLNFDAVYFFIPSFFCKPVKYFKVQRPVIFKYSKLNNICIKIPHTGDTNSLDRCG